MTAVVVEGEDGKEYRLPERDEIEKAGQGEKGLPDLFAQIPFGLPEEPTPTAGVGASRAFSVDGYGSPDGGISSPPASFWRRERP